MANPLGYPPKTAQFLSTQIGSGYQHERYRTTGSANVNMMNLGHAGAVAQRTQPVAGLGAFQVAPPRNSPAGKAMRALASQNRGQAGTIPASFLVDYKPPQPTPAQRTYSQNAIDDAAMRADMLLNNIAFMKQLGWDQEGTSTLWHYTNFYAAQGNLVCKIRLDPANPAFWNERAYNMNMRRSPHVIQYARVSEALSPLDPIAAAACHRLDSSADFAWTKHAPHGDLRSWIARVVSQEENFPRSVLWRLFDCLADACIAMAYPPIRQLGPNPGFQTSPDLPEIIPPAVPPVPLQWYMNLIHTALDPSHVFLEEYDNTNHSDIPRLQVGNLARAVFPGNWGWGVFMPLNVFTRLNDFWRTRLLGRDGWWLPEQFTAEWDRVNYEPFSEGFTNLNTGAGAAGALTPKSNIFHVGMIISCCMLLQAPERPPIATPVPASGANMGNLGWTYLGEMKSKEFHGRFGQKLCYLVRDCCMHMPAGRPDLDGLKNRIAEGMAANPITEDDRRFIRSTMYYPGNPQQFIPEPATQGPGLTVSPLEW